MSLFKLPTFLFLIFLEVILLLTVPNPFPCQFQLPIALIQRLYLPIIVFHCWQFPRTVGIRLLSIEHEIETPIVLEVVPENIELLGWFLLGVLVIWVIFRPLF